MTGGKTNTRRRRKKYGVGEGWGIDVGWKEEWCWDRGDGKNMGRTGIGEGEDTMDELSG
jgi:hypothetical protein